MKSRGPQEASRKARPASHSLPACHAPLSSQPYPYICLTVHIHTPRSTTAIS